MATELSWSKAIRTLVCSLLLMVCEDGDVALLILTPSSGDARSNSINFSTPMVRSC